MSQSLKIKGGKPLNGEIYPVPNKNAVLPVLAASLLAGSKVTLFDIPETLDVKKMLEMIELLGAKVNAEDYSKITIDPSSIESHTIDKELGSQIRASILFAGPLLAKFKKVRIPLPGGCELGVRSINSHLDAFSKAGIEYTYDNGYMTLKAPKEHTFDPNVWLIEASVTPTENLLMYLAGIDKEVEITEAASEPHVSQLIDILSQMGAKIHGKGSNKINIKGTTQPRSFEFKPYPDHIDIAGIMCAALLTKGRITIKNSNNYNFIGGIKQFYEKWGLRIEGINGDLLVDGTKGVDLDLKNSGFPLAAKDLPKVNPRPWPGFPVDALPPVVTLASKNNGKVLVQNWMYETGLNFVTILNSLGANIYVVDPQKVIVNGPIDFKGGKVMAPHVIEATKAIFLAALTDGVETTIENAEILKRRYPDIVGSYRSLGADIQEVNLE